MATSGHKIQFGVDTLANPSLIDGKTLAIDSVNRAYRGGINDTRPPFQLLNLVFDNEKERTIFEKGSVTGIKGYNAVPPHTRSHIVVTVATHVFAGQVMGNTAYMKLLYDELDPQYLFQFFVQGETLLVINNGKTEGIFWNGQIAEMKKISESPWIVDNVPSSNSLGKKFPMPIGNISIYAHGRFWILTEDGRLYAGDHLYSKGINASDEVLLSFLESAYPASGDGFTATAEWGDARGLAVIARDPSTNGHGEVICFHVNGAYSVTPLDDRNKWTAENIQQTVFSGIGGCSPWSIVTVNNDLFFRDSTKRISSLRQTAAQRTQELQIRPISNEVIKYLDFDSFDTLPYSMSGTDDNRIFFTVNHQTIDNPEYGGKHRFGNGVVVCDLGSGTSATHDSLSWDGLWTGPRITGITQLLFGTEKKCVFASYDKDGINRLYTLRRFRGDDILPEAPSEIVSMYGIGNMFDTLGLESGGEIKQFTLTNALIFFSDSVGKSSIAADYRANYGDNWYQLYEDQDIGLDPDPENMFFDVTNGAQGSSSAKSVTEFSGRKSISGVAFDMRVKIKGSVMIRANFLSADPSEIRSSFSRQCDNPAGIRFDQYDYFAYQF